MLDTYVYRIHLISSKFLNELCCLIVTFQLTFNHKFAQSNNPHMSYYDEVEIEDMEFNEDDGSYHYPCPCGDLFQITLEQLKNKEEIATCPSCSLVIRVIYNPEDFEIDEDEEDDNIPNESNVIEIGA
jgi:diphthamide biosynthesis protein 3